MMEESSIFFKESYTESSATILPSMRNTFIDAVHSEIHLHDEEHNLHLCISYLNNTLNFSVLSTIKTTSDTSNKALSVSPLILSEEINQIIQTQCSNISVKQLKMARLNKGTCDGDYNLFEPVSPTFSQLHQQQQQQQQLLQIQQQQQQQQQEQSNLSGIKQSYVVCVMLEQEVIGLSFILLSYYNAHQNTFSHSMENMRINKIELEGSVSEIHLNREREQIIVCVSNSTQTKLQLLDQVFSTPLIKDIATFQNETERIIGNIGVSTDFSMVRLILRMEKDFKRFFIYTYHLSYFEGAFNTSNNISLKTNLNKKPFSSIMNESNYNICQNLFSLSSSYLAIQDATSIEVQDFNNLSVKNIIKEYNPKASQLSQQQCQNSCAGNKVPKLMYNLDKSTLLIANSSLNSCMSIYNLENPISVLEPIPSLGIAEAAPIKRVIISQCIQKSQTPCSANNLMEMYSNLKQCSNSNLILMLVLLDNEANTIVPVIIDKDNIDQKLPELKYVSSQITNFNYNNQDDSMNFFNDYETGFAKTSKHFDVFKTPDRKASINLMNSSLENSKFHFSSSQINNQNNSGNYNYQCHTSQSQNNSLNFNTYTQNQNQRQSQGQNGDNQMNMIRLERSQSQESIWSKKKSGQKRTTGAHNNRTLFNENSNTINMEEVNFQGKTVSGKNNTDSSLFDKISPTQQKIEEAINSSDSEECYSIRKSRIDSFDPSSPLLTQIKQQNRLRDQRGSMRRKDVSRITMKTQQDSIPSYMFQRAEVSQDDIMELSSTHAKCNSLNDVNIAIHSQTQEDIENPFFSESCTTFYKDDNNNNNNNTQRSTATSKNTFYSVSTSISKFERSKGNIIGKDSHLICPVNASDKSEFDSFKMNGSEINLNQYDTDLQMQTKIINKKRNNNIFNKQNTTPNSSARKSNQSNNSISNQKGLQSFFTTSPSPQSSSSKSFPFNQTSKNVLRLKSQILSSTSSSSSSNRQQQQSSNKNQQPNLISGIKPFNMYTQTKLFTNETQNQFQNNKSLLKFGKQLFQDDSSLTQLPLYKNNSNSSNNNNNNTNNTNSYNNTTQNKGKQQQQQSEQMDNIQSLLVKRKSPYQIQQFTSSSNNNQ